jgi:hypothetical protein
MYFGYKMRGFGYLWVGGLVEFCGIKISKHENYYHRILRTYQ